MTTVLPPTPMMAQWHECKVQSPDAILFFRLGDFYEAFYDDAEIIAKELDLTLTKRQEIPMAGVPHHICDTYIDRLVAKGYRVAIAEQMEDPKQVKGIVKRGVTRIVTPGTVINSSLTEDKEQNFLASLFFLNKTFGLALLDITTADFFVVEFDKKQDLFDELARVHPKEILLPKKWKEASEWLKELKGLLTTTVHYLDSFHFDHQSALTLLQRHFHVQSLDSFGLKGMISGINAAGALLTYVTKDLHLPIDHITKIHTHVQAGFMLIDKSTQRHLELLHPLHQGEKKTTLLSFLDQTKTPMGGRLMRRWIAHPLYSVEKIKKRQARVGALMQDFSTLLSLRKALSEVRDLERLIMRIETGFASPRDLMGLRTSLEQLPSIAPLAKENFPDLSEVTQKVASALVDNPPLRLSDGGLFKKGYHPDLDQLLTFKEESTTWVAAYQTRLRELHGIKTLKVGYTKAFGYYIEVSKGQSEKVPASFHRRQTLVNAERFITDELKSYEYKILSADEKINALEAQLFTELRQAIAVHGEIIRQVAKKIGQLDCFASLALTAIEHKYVCPLIDEGAIFEIKEGRHPMIEAHLGASFIPNDIYFDGSQKQLGLITGPNMAGKSTFIRQVALIAIMAQMGSFVPATSAHIGLIDKVFSRIGASDDLTRGQSTFMVEMTETANILHNATDRSLALLDELGRGTSTYDGISIAWAVAQYLLTQPQAKAKTLFATHYFELTDLAKIYPSAFNLNVTVVESGEGITFLHKIQPGTADKSYGIHVARLAGLPHAALKIAEHKLHELEKQEPKPKKQTAQLDLFALKEEPPPHPLLEELKATDPNAITPLEALQRIMQWKKMI